MGRLFARVLVLLALALTAANAECFTRCLVHPANHASMPCHSKDKAKPSAPQHDFELVSAHSQAPAGSQVVALAHQDENCLPSAREYVSFALSPSPPILDTASSPLPLRI